MQISSAAAAVARPNRLFVMIFIAALLALLAGYYFFLRQDYGILYTGLRPTDAAAVVAELDTSGITYELRDDGTTILVPEGRVGEARLAVAGSDAEVRGNVGFELFNQSDMGLTDFAQRINYQRALQGELARTIMMMGGIESARVHLAMPERALFRSDRSPPKAAVTITPRAGNIIDSGRVAGIQRLVAAAVPELTVSDVVVLDGTGRAISASPASEEALAPDSEVLDAVRHYYRGRIRAAIERALPDLRFDVRLVAAPRNGSEETTAPLSDPTLPTPDSNSATRQVSLMVVVVTPRPLASEDRDVIGTALREAVGLNPAIGDSLNYSLANDGPAPNGTRADVVPPAQAAPAPIHGGQSARQWSLWIIAFAAIALILVLFLRSRTPLLRPDAREAFVSRIRDELRSDEANHDAQ